MKEMSWKCVLLLVLALACLVAAVLIAPESNGVRYVQDDLLPMKTVQEPEQPEALRAGVPGAKRAPDGSADTETPGR